MLNYMNEYEKWLHSGALTADEVKLIYLENIGDYLYVDYDRVAPQEKLDYVRIDGDVAGQQGIRFNIFQLFSTYYGEDAQLNIGPKGFTGEKYGGATYWDTEAYCLPMYTAIAGEEVAQNLLKYRWLQIDGAYHNARQQGLPGALYPMVTFTGVECHNEWEITFEEIHRNNAIAYAIYAYTQYTGDRSYLDQYGIDVLLGNGLPAGLLGTGAVVGTEEAAEEDGGGEGEGKNDAGVFHGGASFAFKS